MTCNSYKDCELADDFAVCHLEKPEKILLECGRETGSRTFTSTGDAPFQLANVTIDTSSLNKSEVLIKFSSQVSLESLEDDLRTIRLQYTLFRAYNDEASMPLGSWIFEDIENEFGLLEESFNFIFCDSLKFFGCCTYFVTVTPIDMTNATATVSNGQMAALAQALGYDSKDSYKKFDSLCDKESKLTHKPNDTILTCGQGNGSIVFKGMGLQISSDIANVTVDTSLLNKPKVLIEFSCIVYNSEDFEDYTLQFELFRACGDSEAISLNTWRISLLDIDELIGKSFSFIFCECAALSKCCEYFVRITPLLIGVCDVADILIVNSARITALAQSSRESSSYDEFKAYNEKRDYINYKLPYAKPKDILLECGIGTGNRTFTSSSDIPFTLANVSIDTTPLYNPIVNINFSSIVNFETIAIEATAHLRYELFRRCDNRETVSLGIWEIQKELVGGVRFEKTETFNFTFCEYLLCPGYCDYFVTVTALEVVSLMGFSNVTVSNGRIAALAQERVNIYLDLD